MDSLPEKRCFVKWRENYVSTSYEGYRKGGYVLRSNIDGLSVKSGRGLKQLLDNVPERLLPWRSLLSLTYPEEYPKDGRVVKRHLNTLAMWLKRYFGEDFAGAWVMEFQDRGAPHLHLLTNGFMPHRLLGRRWYEIVGSGDDRHLKAGVRAEKPRGNLAAYLLKRYLRKGKQKIVPPDFIFPGRMWGHWGKWGNQLGQVEVSDERVEEKVDRELRRLIEARMRAADRCASLSGARSDRPAGKRKRRRLPRVVRAGRYCGKTSYRGGELLATQLLVWATGEVAEGR